MQPLSKVTSEDASVTTPTPRPWRRGVAVSKSGSDQGMATATAGRFAEVKAAPVTPPWRRGQVSASTRHDEPSTPKHVAAEDEISTATECSDGEETASTLSRSSSFSDLAPVISRDIMLLHRCRHLHSAAEKQSGLHCRSSEEGISKYQPPALRKKAAPRAPAAPKAPAGFAAPPGLELLNGAALAPPVYTPPFFRKEFMAILKDLAIDRNVARAVRRVRAQGVPRDRQAAEYADAITFILEETRGAARRSFVALLAGLAYGVFDRKECMAGLGIFFVEIYPDLQAEVPKLSKLVTVELLATLASVFNAEELSRFATLAKAEP